MAGDDVFHHLAGDAGKGNRCIIDSFNLSPFLNTGAWASLQSEGRVVGDSEQESKGRKDFFSN